MLQMKVGAWFVCSRRGVILAASSGVASILGVELAADLIGLDLERVLGIRLEPGREPPREIETGVRRGNGIWTWVRVELCLVEDGLEMGDPPVVVGCLVDVSARVQVDALVLHTWRDPLTSLPNRAQLVEGLASSLARKEPLALLLVDIDGFRAVNDGMGRRAGDELLQEAAERIRSCVRPSDLCARVGADEFAVVLEQLAHGSDASLMARRIAETIAAPMRLGTTEVAGEVEFEIEVSCHIGVALAPQHGGDAESLIRSAEIALHRAQKDFVVYSEETARRVSHTMSVKNRLRKAIEGDELVLHYQPIVSLAGGEVTGYEALVRWNHPELGVLRPHEFIPIAEESSLIVQVGEWVLRRACAAARQWPGKRVAVNLAPEHFRQPELPRTIARLLDELGLPAQALEVELTERTAARSSDLMLSILAEIRALGVGIAIDDFGTGYASLDSVTRFPVTSLKIDRSFVAALPHSSPSAIVTTVLALARELGLNVVAEGVETEEQLEFLRARGCAEAQGYLLGMPRAVRSMEREG
jgi:diguanylate cyclase (GGDEF)-like protein